MKKKCSKKDLGVEICEFKGMLDMVDDTFDEKHKSETIELMKRMCKKWLKIDKMAKFLGISDNKLYDLVEDCISD